MLLILLSEKIIVNRFKAIYTIHGRGDIYKGLKLIIIFVLYKKNNFINGIIKN